MLFNLISGVLGGLGLFLYGLNVVTKVLRSGSYTKLKKIVQKLTSNVFMATGLGVIVTSIVQSSSATTVLLVSLINAGIITLGNTIGVIFGANVGSTLTVQIIAFNLDNFIFPAIFVGTLLRMLSKKYRNIANIVLGFGLLFLGLSVMKDSTVVLRQYEGFTDFVKILQNNSFSSIALLLIASMLITSVLQASGATIAIVIALASTGIITDLRMTLPLILGAKLGTCITAFLASLNSSRDAKRIAFTHFLFNIVVAILAFVFIDYLISITEYSSDNIVRQIANIHSFTSIFAVLVLLPISSRFIKLSEKILPVKKNESNRKDFFNYDLIDTPALAVESVYKSVLEMAKTVKSMMNLFSKENADAKQVYDLENYTDHLREHSGNYIMEISRSELSGELALKLNNYREIINNLERVGDNIENIIDNIICIKEWEDILSDDSIKYVINYMVTQYSSVLKVLKNADEKLSENLLEAKYKEKAMYKDYAKKLSQTIAENKLDANTGILLTETIHNIQRVSYYLRRILYSANKLFFT